MIQKSLYIFALNDGFVYFIIKLFLIYNTNKIMLLKPVVKMWWWVLHIIVLKNTYKYDGNGEA